jgi:PAS domain-containing protein
MKHSSSPFLWDDYSDQPHPIKDRAYKKAQRKKYLSDIVGYWVNIIIFPLAYVMAFLLPNRRRSTNGFFGMGVNLDKGEEQAQLIKKLGVKELFIRVYLSEIDKLDEYESFIKSFEGCEIAINLVQDRANIEDHKRLEANIMKLFEKLHGIKAVQVGTTINRSKWGFFAVGEYLKFYQVVERVRDNHFPHLELWGPSVIDYEYHVTIRALFNLIQVNFDRVSSLLYVDRRGTPEYKQSGLNLVGKIKMLSALTLLSPKSQQRIVITETNWPLSNTAPYAPTSELECVSEAEYDKFMVRYYLLALATGRVDRIYWHQLIAPGYGLVDNREGEIKKRTAFYAYQNMLERLQDQEVKMAHLGRDEFEITFESGLKVVWVIDHERRIVNGYARVYDIYGYESATDDLYITDSPLYLYPKGNS